MPDSNTRPGGASHGTGIGGQAHVSGAAMLFPTGPAPSDARPGIPRDAGWVADRLPAACSMCDGREWIRGPRGPQRCLCLRGQALLKKDELQAKQATLIPADPRERMRKY